MHARAFCDQRFADVNGGAFTRVTGVGLKCEPKYGDDFAVERVEKLRDDAAECACEQGARRQR